MPRHAEPALLESRPEADGLYWFCGAGQGFAPLIGHSATVRGMLLAAVRPELLPKSERSPFVAVHVRRGDFTLPSSSELSQGKHNYRIPIDWYLDALRMLRSSLGKPAPAIVFSDGAENELAPLLSENATTLCRNQHAVVDLLKMSEASALIASGSTFSMWASFLGQVPAVWYPGQRRELLLSQGRGTLEPEWASGQFSAEFLGTVRTRLALD